MTEADPPPEPREEPPQQPPAGPPPPSWPPPGTPPPPQGTPPPPPPGTPPPPPSSPPPGTPPPYPTPPGGGWGPPPGGPPPAPQWGQPGGYPPPAQGTGSLAENVASGLSYALTWVTGLIFFLVDRRPEVRFHAMQAIAFGVLWTLVVVLRAWMPGPLDLLFSLASFVLLVTWVVLLIQGFQGRHFKLPVLGDFAEQQAAKPSL
jgi:uncharacterized membrane protein